MNMSTLPARWLAASLSTVSLFAPPSGAANARAAMRIVAAPDTVFEHIGGDLDDPQRLYLRGVRTELPALLQALRARAER